MTQAARLARYLSFAALALLVNGLVFLTPTSGIVRTALFFDCAVTVPLCYWLLLVRSGRRGKASLALIAAVSVMRGAYLLNSNAAMAVGIAAEVSLVLFVVTRVQSLEDVLPSKTLLRIVRAELDVFRHAFGRSQPQELPAGARAFTIHESSGATSLFWSLAFLTPFEAAGMHFILPPKVAWILTALSIYSALWMIAVARSFARLPLVVAQEGITLRRGMLASMHVPRAAIASVSRIAPSAPNARFAVLSDPTVWITFDKPLKVELPLGFTRETKGAAIAPDDASGFIKALSEN